MNDNPRQFNRFYWAVSAVVFVIVFLRCTMVPFAHDEVATFNFYIQNGNFIPFLSHVDAMGHFLLSAASWLCFKLFGSSTLVLRLPLLVSFVIMCLAVFKFNNLFTSLLPKLILTAAFLLSYNFVAFFSLARGYGISMAFLLLALFYFYCYLKHFSFRHLWKFLVFSQLALSANLTLVMVLMVTTFIVIFFQLKERLFLSLKNILIYCLHFSLLAFWIKFGFFLQKNGALYYGGGSSYWVVTFHSLIEILVGKNQMAAYTIVSFFMSLLVFFIYQLYHNKTRFLFNSNFATTLISMLLLIAAFYLLKKLFGVNYPEDRTGLFFYVFFILSVCFMLNETSAKWRLTYLVLPVFCSIQFILQLNFRIHPWRIYETIPKQFYDTLLKEQSLNPEVATIGGHRLREFIWGFMNYNQNAKLAYMTSPEALQMNCDYAIAYKEDKPWYTNYYNELATETDWGFVLLKRKEPLIRHEIIKVDNLKPYTGSYEYYNAFEKTDTTFNTTNPLIAEFNITVKNAPVPFNAWLVVEINSDSQPEENVFVRVPLNLIRYNWNNSASYKAFITTGNIPLKIKRLVCYLWNIEKKEINIQVNSFRLLKVTGQGVTQISKAKI